MQLLDSSTAKAVFKRNVVLLNEHAKYKLLKFTVRQLLDL